MAKVNIPGWALKLLRNTQSNARKRNIDFDLTPNDMRLLLVRSKGVCEVSGLAFTLAYGNQPGVKAGQRVERRPWAPSIDRIDNLKGYYVENCRLVCCVANLAMNEWGEPVLHRLAHAVASRPRSHRIFTEFLQQQPSQPQHIELI